jgi:hypothetical protein
MSGTYTFCIRPGTDWTQTLTWTSGGTPVDLTGWSAHMQIRSDPGGELYADISTAAGGITLGGDAGTITLTIANAVTGAWTWDNAYYDLLMTDTSGNISCLLSGQVIANPGITQ